MLSSSLNASVSSSRSRAIEYLRDLWNRREFALALGLGNLKARNASSALGVFWWILNPLLLGGVYFLIFGLIFGGRRPPDFLIYLLSGMFVFHFTSQSMTGGANSIIQNSKLLANLRFPRLILPISALIESLAGFLASLLVLIPTIWIAQLVLMSNGSIENPYIGYRLLYLPGIVALQVILNLGLGAMTARLAVPFRDINNLLPYVNRIWLYVSPIIWPLSFLDNASSQIQALVKLNPMFHLIGLYRSALFGTPIHSGQLLTTLLWVVVVGGIGVAAFVKYEGHIVRHL